MKATVEIPRGSVEKLSRRESVKGGKTVPVWVLRLSRSTVLAPKALSWGDSYSKDFQQLLGLPKSWGLIANEARRHPIPNFCGPYSKLLCPYSKLLCTLFQTSASAAAPAAAPIDQWGALKLISHFSINCRISPVMCGHLNLPLLPIEVGSLNRPHFLYKKFSSWLNIQNIRRFPGYHHISIKMCEIMVTPPFQFDPLPSPVPISPHWLQGLESA